MSEQVKVRVQDSAHPSIVDVECIDHATLMSLFDMSVIAIRIRGFYDPAYCEALSRALHDDVASTTAPAGTIYASNIDSFWAARQNEQRLDRYLDSATVLEDKLRSLCAPHASPVDMIKWSLRRAWKSGVTAMSTKGRAMPFGFTRLWSEGSEALPHQDVLWREIPDDRHALGQIGQLAVNLYLDTATNGGELELWNFVVDDDQYRVCGSAYEGSYGFPRARLPAESVLLTPQVGDLVLINSLRVHAVRRVDAGQRITLSGFIGSWGSDRPLRCWS